MMPRSRKEALHIQRDLLALEEAIAAQGELILRLLERIDLLERGQIVPPQPQGRSAGGALSEMAGRQLVRDVTLRVAARFGIDAARIAGSERVKPVAEARQAVMFEAALMGVPDAMIGRALRRDHSTIAHGRRAEAARRGLGVAGNAA